MMYNGGIAVHPPTREPLMILKLPPTLHVTVPASARTLAGFRRWAASDEFPETGKISYLAGELFIDMSPETFHSHNQVKAEINGVLQPLVKKLKLGKFCPDRLLITNDEAKLSTEADATFLSWARLESGEVRLIPGREERDGIEMRGSPDWVLEIVSDTSVRKDTVRLLELYYRANVREYWLIDARGDSLQFTIYRRGRKGFDPTPAVRGWIASEVFPRRFRLIRERDRIGGWTYTLKVAKPPASRKR
jgi:Uma2 family endonuclease